MDLLETQSNLAVQAVSNADVNFYKKIYRILRFSIYQSLIMTLLSKNIFDKWPAGLPEEIKESLIKARTEVKELYLAMLDDKITHDQMNAELDQKKLEWRQAGKFPDLFIGAFRLHLFRPDQSATEIDFSRIIYSQALVMMYAHMDAFMADTLRVICHARPEVLKCNKKLDWAEIVSCGDWNKVIEKMTEDYVFDFGWQPIRKRLEFLRERLGLNINIDEKELQKLETSNLIRDLTLIRQ